MRIGTDVVRAAVVAAMVFGIAACGRPSEQGAGGGGDRDTAGGAVVMTSFYPLTYFAERIGGDAVEVRCPVPADADPALWSPAPADIATMQSAGVVFINGASFEAWVATAPLARSRVVDTTEGFRDELIKYEHATTHSHGPGGAHSHEGIDGHTWLDPVLAIAQAEAVRDGLVNAFGEHETGFIRGCAELVIDLRRLDTELKSLAEEMDGVTVIANHPAYNYVAKRYGWHIITLDLPPEEPIDEAALGALEAANLRPKRVMLWESEPIDQNAATMMDRFGAASVVFSPCEAPAEADYVQRMHENIARLRDGVGG